MELKQEYLNFKPMTVRSVITSAILLMLFMLALSVIATVIDGTAKRNSMKILRGGIERTP